MKVWIYVRKSRALGDPDDDPQILAHQREALLRLANSMGLGEPAVIEEVGSGERLETRVRLAALLRGWEQRQPPPGSVLMATGVERVTRGDLFEAGVIVRYLEEAGVAVQTLSQRFDLTKTDDKTLFSMLAIMGNHQLSQNRRDTMLRKDQLTREGKLPTGKAPLGYRWDRNPPPETRKPGEKPRGQLVVVESELAIVRRLFALAPNYGLTELSRQFGMPVNTIRNILHNPVYTGFPHRHCRKVKSRNGKVLSRQVPRDQWTVRSEQPGDYPPAVSVEQFERVQEAMASRYRHRAKPGEAAGWCRDILEIEERDCRVTLASQRSGRRNIPAYRFLDRQTGAMLYVDRQIVHGPAEKQILSILSAPELLALALQQRDSQKPDASSPDREALRNRLARLRSTMVRLKLQIAEESEDAIALHHAERTVRAEIDDVKARLSEIDSRISHKDPPLPLQEIGRVMAKEAPAAWRSLIDIERREMTRCLLKRIVLRVTSMPRPQPAVREVVRIDLADWLEPFRHLFPS